MNVTRQPYFIEAFPIRTIGSQTLQGHSISTERTGFYSHSLGVHLDAGVASYIPVKRLFLTHTHSDHYHHLAMLIHSNPEPPIVYCPIEIMSEIKRAIDMYYISAFDQQPYTLVGVYLGYEEVFKSKGREYLLKVYNCTHPVPTVCYGFSEYRNKLREEYKNMSGIEIGRLRDGGVEVVERVSVPVFAYVCDTSIEALTEELLEYEIVMVECTFWEERALEKGHICWTKLREVVRKYPSTIFILFHVSKRYSWEEIDTILKNDNYQRRTVVRLSMSTTMNVQEYYNIIVKEGVSATRNHPISQKILSVFDINESTGIMRVIDAEYDWTHIHMLWLYFRFSDTECLKLYPDPSSISKDLDEYGGLENICNMVNKYKDYYKSCERYFKMLINDPSDISFIKFIPNEHNKETFVIIRIKDKFIISTTGSPSDSLNNLYMDLDLFGKFVMVYYDNQLK